MEHTNWLPLIEYSNKHNVSISTLRRRIKDNSIPYKLEDGKYFITDDMIEKTTKGRKPIQFQNTVENSPTQELPVETITDEIKRAYSTALHSKEELIFQMREEISDLKTLVRVLEEEIERLKNSPTTSRRY